MNIIKKCDRVATLNLSMGQILSPVDYKGSEFRIDGDALFFNMNTSIFQSFLGTVGVLEVFPKWFPRQSFPFFSFCTLQYLDFSNILQINKVSFCRPPASFYKSHAFNNECCSCLKVCSPNCMLSAKLECSTLLLVLLLGRQAFAWRIFQFLTLSTSLRQRCFFSKCDSAGLALFKSH